MSTVSRASGLIDEQGYFWPNCTELRRHVVPEAAEAEMRCQVDRAMAAGIDVTHLDAHMGAAAIPELLDAYLRLGAFYQLPVVLPRAIDGYLKLLLGNDTCDNAEVYRAAVRQIESTGPVVDHFRSGTGAPSDQAEHSYKAMLLALPPGLTYLALHANAPGDIEQIFPLRAHRRTDEYRIFQGPAFGLWAAERGIAVTDMRSQRTLMRRQDRSPVSDPVPHSTR